MKEVSCAYCEGPVTVEDDYEPMGCCDGSECGCMGMIINPVFCDDCERFLTKMQQYNRSEP